MAKRPNDLHPDDLLKLVVLDDGEDDSEDSNYLSDSTDDASEIESEEEEESSVEESESSNSSDLDDDSDASDDLLPVATRSATRVLTPLPRCKRARLTVSTSVAPQQTLAEDDRDALSASGSDNDHDEEYAPVCTSNKE